MSTKLLGQFWVTAKLFEDFLRTLNLVKTIRPGTKKRRIRPTTKNVRIKKEIEIRFDFECSVVALR